MGQNAAGKAKWSVEGNSFEQELRKAFASGIPTEAMRERRLKEGRGFSDLDGGGGVYKGKKKKELEDDSEKASKAKERAKEKKKEKRREKYKDNKDKFRDRWK